VIGLGRALTRALVAVELPTTIAIHQLVEPELETRSWGGEAVQGAAAAVPVVINELHVRLPTAITDAVAARLLVELERQIRRWRTDSGHEELEVPIHAGPRDVVVYTIAVDCPG
jgi:hypothetical protein